MAGKPKLDPKKTQAEEIDHLKKMCASFFEKTGVKQAAADWIGRDMETIRRWEQEDREFKLSMLRAKATFLSQNKHKVSPANVLANLYEEYKPPKQEVEAHHTVEQKRPLDQLIEEARRQGIDTTPYERLIGTTSHRGADLQDQLGEGTAPTGD